MAINGISECVSLFYDAQLVVLVADVENFHQCHRIYKSLSRER